MQYSLGIDAGGTYTDAVIVRDSDGKIVDSNKSLTTYPDLLIGIENAIDGLDESYLKDIDLVSLSTTLATNTVLERTGASVGLILIGDHPIKEKLPTKNVISVSGGHDHNGDEVCSLDLASIEDFTRRVMDKVSSFAISSFFSIRNPEHEIKAKEVVQNITGLPVVCGHELSQDIGAYERAVTAFLNAQLIPITSHFIESIISDIQRRGINARILMLKCDGSVVGVQAALERPIETIFSGPAASLVGASYLTGLDTCSVIDVGGTSTDVSSILDGMPELTDEGAEVGSWKTRVRAIRMETSAMGGDSHVWTKDTKISIGPRRVIPLCLAAVKFPGFLDKLKLNKNPPRRQMDENIQTTKFFIRTGHRAFELSDNEKLVLGSISDEPTSINEISSIIKGPPPSPIIDSLIRKRLVQTIGFTPTDALHVLGGYTEWDAEASIVGAEMLSKLSHMGKYELCNHVKTRVARNMVFNLMSFTLPGIDKKGIQRIIDGEFTAIFKVNVPVVLLGGPVGAYVKGIEGIIDAQVMVPDFANVGNAVGALFGKGIKRVEILIRPASLTYPDEDFLVFSPSKRKRFEKHVQAMEYAEEIGRKLVLNYMEECGLTNDQVEINVSKKSVIPQGWTHPPMETKLTFVGVGSSRLYT